MSKRSAADAASGNPANIRLESVNPMWLEASPNERYLLLEDPETGDILMPLIYMKHILEANYSRKLASLKNRIVNVPPTGALARHDGLLYWQWAFESPHAVKVIVRKEIGDATPQGHLRLVLVPIVYNALASRPDLRNTALFVALHRAVRVSTYWPLIRPIAEPVLAEIDAVSGIDPEGIMPEPLFRGPRLLENTAIKYMFMFKDQEEMEASKRNRTTGASTVDNGVLTATIVNAGVSQPTNLADLIRSGSQPSLGQPMPGIASESEALLPGDNIGTETGGNGPSAATSAGIPREDSGGADDGADAQVPVTATLNQNNAAAATAAQQMMESMLQRLNPAAAAVVLPNATARASSMSQQPPMLPHPPSAGPTASGGTGPVLDPAVADAVRQLVDMKSRELKTQIAGLRNQVVMLSDLVFYMAAMASQLPPGLMPGAVYYPLSAPPVPMMPPPYPPPMPLSMPTTEATTGAGESGHQQSDSNWLMKNYVDAGMLDGSVGQGTEGGAPGTGSADPPPDAAAAAAGQVDDATNNKPGSGLDSNASLHLATLLSQGLPSGSANNGSELLAQLLAKTSQPENPSAALGSLFDGKVLASNISGAATKAETGGDASPNAPGSDTAEPKAGAVVDDHHDAMEVEAAVAGPDAAAQVVVIASKPEAN